VLSLLGLGSPSIIEGALLCSDCDIVLISRRSGGPLSLELVFYVRFDCVQFSGIGQSLDHSRFSFSFRF